MGKRKNWARDDLYYSLFYYLSNALFIVVVDASIFARFVVRVIKVHALLSSYR